MRVLRTLSRSVAPLREGIYLLPDTPETRRAAALAEHVAAERLAGASEAPTRLSKAVRGYFDRSGQYEEPPRPSTALPGLAFPIRSHRTGVATGRALFIKVLDFFPSPSREQRAPEGSGTRSPHDV
jgi:hypothetical protein